MRNAKSIGTVALAMIGLTAGPAQAASLSFYMDQTNVNAYGLVDGINYLQVTISDSVFGLDPNAIKFEVTVLSPLASIADNNFGIQSFGFNSSLAAATVNAAITGLPSGWSSGINANQDGFGNFELVDSGNGSSRQNPTLTFYISGIGGDTPADYVALSSGTAGETNQFFAAHVAGFQDVNPATSCPSGGLDPCTVTSGFFGGSTPVVPVPAAAWLFMSALGCLGITRRRRS